MKVVFPLLDKEMEFSEAVRVSEACERAGVPLDLVCGGNGTCGKCKVSIVEAGRELVVLGCQQKISDGMLILAGDDEVEHRLLESVAKTRQDFLPHLRVVRIGYDELQTPMGGYDFTCLAVAIYKTCGVDVEVPGYDVLHAISDVYRVQGFEYLNVVLSASRIVDVVPSNEEIHVYGIAVDVGTTSVAAFLYDLTTGELIDHGSDLNDQHIYGADVISRIEHASESAENRAAEQRAISKTVNGLIEELCTRNAIDKDLLYEMAYCGNSTMQHLFLGLNPRPLGRVPFAGLISQSVEVDAKCMDIGINRHGTHVFMPLIGGFVGADTIACLLEFPEDGKTRMMIDLGTNCEVALGSGSVYMVTSTACGPALEGAGLSMGMRAVDGAIEHVDYDAESNVFVFKTIGHADPIGFCGSGIIDMVALMHRLGIITPKGAFPSGDALEASPFKDRIRKDDEKGLYFVALDSCENPCGIEISMTIKDVRAIQLAKAAIRTGWTLLSRTYGIDLADLAEIRLAGAFGNYIDIENAQSIGMLPQYENVPVTSMGNGAGLGVQRFLLSEAERARAESIRVQATHVELAHDKEFIDTYVSCMRF